MRPAPHTECLAVIAVLASAMVASVMVASLAAADSPAPSKIAVKAAWIRWLPAGLPAAGYLTLTNTGDKPLALDGASSPAYGDVSIHRSIRRGATETMTPVEQLTLEPHQTVEFESTGYHLMLMQPAASAGTAARIPITLHFSDASSLIVPFEVRKSRAGAPAP